MTKKDFFIFMIIFLVFVFWYGGIFIYFKLVNQISNISKELNNVSLEIKNLKDFNLFAYLKQTQSFLEDNQQLSFFNFFQLENLIFQSKIFSFCSENDYYCLRLNFTYILNSCLDNKELNSCLQEIVGQKYYQKISLLEDIKKALENRLFFLKERTKNLAFIINPFILLGNIFNPSLANFQFDLYEKNNDFGAITIATSSINFQEIDGISYYEKFYTSSIKSKKEITKSKKTLINFSSSTLTLSTIATGSKTESSTTLNLMTIETSTTSSIPKNNYGGSGYSFKKDPCDDLENKNFPKLVISEVQFETIDQKEDEFIEIYNPNTEDVDLTCWSLDKYSAKTSLTSSPSLTTLIPSSKFQGLIKSKSFFLITSSSTKSKYKGDISYPESYSLANNNVLILRYPNGQISDLVGYGSDRDKIYIFESEPFLFNALEGRTIQRKNFIDRDNNLKDFWLRLPNPENSSQSRLPRDDFIDLGEILLTDFRIFATTSGEETTKYFLDISFKEPKLIISPLNYFFDLLIGTSTNFFNFNLADFESTTSLPRPKFDDSLVNFQIEINKCPTNYTNYYFNLFLKDKLDSENFSLPAITSSTLPDELCNFREPISSSTEKVFFSEVKIVEGINNNDEEYIELYNPNKFNINLTGWSIKKINRNGEVQKTSIVGSQKFKEVIIKPFSYLLLANKDFIGDNQVKSNIVYSSSAAYGLTSNNGLVLINNNNQIVDKICWGNISNYSDCLDNLKEDKVFLRKAGRNSTEETMKNEEKSYGNSFDSEIVKNNFLMADPEPQNSFSEEIPPTNFTQEKFFINDEKIIIEFVSPYQKLDNAKYEVKVNDLNLEPLPLLSLPLVNPYGEKEKIEFNGCSFGLENNDKIYLLLKENEKINYFKEFEVKDFECNPMIIKLKNSILAYFAKFDVLNKIMFKLYHLTNNFL
ncbi:MAG: hypothetical protein KatS3mg095_0421 [Candidatus Parcubacteria bacterium]|nr:MAG: hypothetical protein KatS3mg095_0421 [Candidatus Parcubacteria bacterium]